VMTDRLALDAPERLDRRYTRGNAFFDPTGKLSVRDLPARPAACGRLRSHAVGPPRRSDPLHRWHPHFARGNALAR
jgi:hypothetical protein